LSGQGRTRFGACALVTILADGRSPRSRGAGWSSSSTVAWRPSVCSAATVIRLLLHGLVYSLLHGLVHSLLLGLVHSLLLGLLHGLLHSLLHTLRMRTASRSLGCRHRRKGAQAGGVMTIEYRPWERAAHVALPLRVPCGASALEVRSCNKMLL
jgi:hypothetical protein